MRDVLDMSEIPAVILAGGLATRLRPITEKIPKALVEVAGRPFIDHQLELLADNCMRRVVLCLGHLGEMVRDHVGDGSQFGLRVDYSFDGNKLLGTGGALRRAKHLLGRICWVMYGDSYMDIDYRAILARFGKSNALGLMTVIRNDDQWDKSNVVFEGGRLLHYDKKSTLPSMHHVDYGVALLRRQAIDWIPADVPFDLANLYTGLVAHDLMMGCEVKQRFYEIGSPKGLEETRDYLQRRRVA